MSVPHEEPIEQEHLEVRSEDNLDEREASGAYEDEFVGLWSSTPEGRTATAPFGTMGNEGALLDPDLHVLGVHRNCEHGPVTADEELAADLLLASRTAKFWREAIGTDKESLWRRGFFQTLSRIYTMVGR